MFKKVEKCRICESKNLKKYLDLGNQPLANSLGKYSEKFPLQVLLCEDCCLSQLSIVVDPEILYKDYPYSSSVSQTFKDHCYQMANDLDVMFYEATGFGIEHSTITDIAANDGCLLDQFKKVANKGWLVAVEPAKNLADICAEKGFKTINEFYSHDCKVPTSRIITATNVLAHVDNIKDFVNTIRDDLNILDSVCVIEVPYLVDLIDKNEFDTIYHEHLSYFLLKPLKILFELCGLRIFKVERKRIHGGTIRIYACLKVFLKLEYSDKPGKDYFPKESMINSSEVFKDDGSVGELLELEEKLGMYDFKSYLNFSNNVEYVKRKLYSKLEEIYLDGDVVMGYGASAKGINLLNICGIRKEFINSIVDDTPEKQGKKIPGLGIRIVPFEKFEDIYPDYILILAWNFAEELIRKTKVIGKNDIDYIIPIPRPVIV